MLEAIEPFKVEEAKVTEAQKTLSDKKLAIAAKEEEEKKVKE